MEIIYSSLLNQFIIINEKFSFNITETMSEVLPFTMKGYLNKFKKTKTL